MRIPKYFLFFGAASLFAQSVLEDPVVAKVNGQELRASEVQKMAAGADPRMQQGLKTTPQTALEYLLLVKALNEHAEKDKLAEKTLWKDQIEYLTRQLIAQTELAYRTNAVNVTEAEQLARYEADKANYEQAKVKIIYISFLPDNSPVKPAPGKKYLTEAEAKQKAQALAKEARAGADFAKLAKENSEDQASAEKGGDFGTIKRPDKIDEDLKKAIFALQPGEISDPVKQPNGYYIVKLESRAVQPFNEIRSEQWEQIRQEKFQQWLQSIRDQNKVTIENADFFKSGKAAR